MELKMNKRKKISSGSLKPELRSGERSESSQPSLHNPCFNSTTKGSTVVNPLQVNVHFETTTEFTPAFKKLWQILLKGGGY